MKRSARIILIGFMGSGKSVVGRLLARRLQWKFIDTDRLVERKKHARIRTIVREEGWPAFRRLEREALKRALTGLRVVVATGGGIVLDPRNRRLMKRKGVVVYLSARPETIWKRVRLFKTRPLLQVRQPLRVIRRILKRRLPLYGEADIQVVTDHRSPVAIAAKILTATSSNDRR